MKAIKATLLLLALFPATGALAKDSVVTTKKTFESSRCTTWDLTKVMLEDKELFVYFLDNVDVCFIESGEIYSYSIPRTVLSAEKGAQVTVAFAAASKSENCIEKISASNYSTTFGVVGETSEEVIILTKGKGTFHRDITKVCAKIFVELSE